MSLHPPPSHLRCEWQLARRRGVAEAFATFALVFAGCGAIVVNSENDGSLGELDIAGAFGLVITAMTYATGHVSART
jgi:aquaporin Z